MHKRYMIIDYIPSLSIISTILLVTKLGVKRLHSEPK